jgi:hypothetical protein
MGQFDDLRLLRCFDFDLQGDQIVLLSYGQKTGQLTLTLNLWE